jgi:hypothetical protein
LLIARLPKAYRSKEKRRRKAPFGFAWLALHFRLP